MERERCISCGVAVAERVAILPDGRRLVEFVHINGSAYCQDRAGFTATPIRAACPPFHPPTAVL